MTSCAHKVCTKCGIEKPLSGFHPRKPSGHHSACKDCYNAYYRERYAMYEATGTASIHFRENLSIAQPTIDSTSSFAVA